MDLGSEDALPTSSIMGREIGIDRRSGPREPPLFLDEGPNLPAMEVASIEVSAHGFNSAEWDEGLADCYREALGGESGSRVIEACIDRLGGATTEVEKEGWVSDPVAGEAEGWEEEASFFVEEEGWDEEDLAGSVRGLEQLPRGVYRRDLVRRRLMAWGIDGLVLASLVGIATIPGGIGVELLVFSGLVSFVYLTLCGSLGGRTLGDRFAGLQTVEGRSGEAPPLGMAALRALVGILGSLLLFVGPLWSIFDEDGRSLHDKVCGTYTLPLALG